MALQLSALNQGKTRERETPDINAAPTAKSQGPSTGVRRAPAPSLNDTLAQGASLPKHFTSSKY